MKRCMSYAFVDEIDIIIVEHPSKLDITLRGSS